jgi:hypothetical protein
VANEPSDRFGCHQPIGWFTGIELAKASDVAEGGALPSGTPHGERPATFREVFGIGEFRAIYFAGALSWVGDYLARAAVTALVYQQTESVVASAAAFAISYAPWLLGGSLLVSLAERYPYRTVMIICDLIRMVLMAAVAIPHLTPPAVLGLLLASALLAPPFEAARSATLPAILEGDRYVVGVAIHTTTAQPAQVAGYALGAAMAGSYPEVALLLNAATFAISAALVRWGVRRRKPALTADRRTHLLAETVDGFRLVFGTRALRAIALVVFGGALFVVLPEGLAAAWAADIAEKPDRGWVQGMIMASVPLGWILGGLSVSRLAPPATRRRLIRPLAICVPLALVAAATRPDPPVVALLAGLSGFAMGGLVPVANGLFVRALPDAYRARAFGVMQGGLALLQGSAVLVTGALAGLSSVPKVVELWSLGGVFLMIMLIAFWPPTHLFDQATAAAHAANGHTPAEPRPEPLPEPLPESLVDPLPESLVDPLPPVPRMSSPGGVSPTAHASAATHPPGTMEP